MLNKTLKTKRTQLLKDLSLAKKVIQIEYDNLVGSYESQWYNNFQVSLTNYKRAIESHSNIKHELIAIEKKLVQRHALKKGDMTQW